MNIQGEECFSYTLTMEQQVWYWKGLNSKTHSVSFSKMLTEEIILGPGEGESSIIVEGSSFPCSSFMVENPLSFFYFC